MCVRGTSFRAGCYAGTTMTTDEQQLETKAEILAEEWAHHAIEEEHERTLNIQAEYIAMLKKAEAEIEALRTHITTLEGTLRCVSKSQIHKVHKNNVK